MDLLRGLFLPRRSPRAPAESAAEPASEDLERIAELAALGSRLDVARPVRAFLDFDVEAAARRAATELAAGHFAVQVRTDGAGRWRLTAITPLAPTPGGVTRLREQMQETARRFGGVYAGWDAAAVF